MVNDRISAAVADSGMKQKFIADKIGISEPSLSALLSGKRKVDVDEFFGLCQILKMKPDELYHYGQRQEAV